MAIVLAESFDNYGGAIARMIEGSWQRNSEAVLQTTDGARTGTYYLNSNGAGGVSDLKRLLDGNVMTSGGVAYAARFQNLPSNSNRSGFTLQSGDGTGILSVMLRNDGFLQVTGGPMSDPVLDTASFPILIGAWNHIETKFVISSSVGSIEVRLNGVSVLSVNDLNLGSVGVTQIFFDSGGATVDQHIDDLVIYDLNGGVANDFIGPARVHTVYPASDSTPAEWTPTGSGTGAGAVDESSPDDDTSFINAATDGDIHAFTMPSLPSEVVDLEGFYVNARSKQVDAGATAFRINARSGAATENGDPKALTTTYAYQGQAFTDDPNTSGAKYTKAAFEAVILEIERTT